jgi:receptor protein-tyrosine kinase
MHHPFSRFADATGLATLVDGVLLSVRYGTTRKDRLRHAAVSPGLVQAKSLGLILNIVPPTTELAPAYGYGYRGRHSSWRT